MQENNVVRRKFHFIRANDNKLFPYYPNYTHLEQVNLEFDSKICICMDLCIRRRTAIELEVCLRVARRG